MPKYVSLKLEHILWAYRKEICLSPDALQPFNCGSLCIWRSWIHPDQGVFLIGTFGFLGNPDIRVYSCVTLPKHSNMTRVESMSHCRKTAYWNWKILRQLLESIISFHLMPRSYLTAAVDAYGQKPIWHGYLRCCISKKNGWSVFIILSLYTVHNISFQMGLYS